MTVLKKGRAAERLIVACAIATAVSGGLTLAAAPASNIRLVGVSAHGTGKTAAVLIESTEPVAYAVSRPDPLTVLVDLRNVSVADAATEMAQAAKNGPVSGVTLEQAIGADGQNLARVRVALASPSSYKVRSSRNVIRLDLEPEAPAPVTPRAADLLPVAARSASTSAAVPTVSATMLEKVHATHTRTATTVTLAGNGRLTPSSLTESDDLPRTLVLDFPNVSPNAAAKTGVDGVFVKQVRVALSSREPLVTRVAMEISPTATYHVERTGPDGRDLAVVFEGRKAGGAIMVAPPSVTAPAAATKDDEDTISMADALANAASITPPDPIAALNTPAPAKPVAVAPAPTQPRVAPPTQPSRATSRAAEARQTQQPPAQPPAQPRAQPPTPPTPAPQPTPTFSQDVPGSGPKQYTGHPINFDFEDADLRAVLRVFAGESGLNMIIDPQVQGRVNVLLNDVPWDQALDQILRSNKLGYTVEGNILRIAPLSVLADEQSEQRKLGDAKALAGELRVQTFALSYAKGEALSPLLTRSALSSRGQIQVDARTNTLIITDLPDRLQTAQSLIATLDRPEPQVEVEARVVQTTRDFARAIGIQWGFNGRANSAIGNTTGLAFPNNGAIGGRVGATTPGSGGTQGPTDPRGGTAGDNAATAVNLGAAAASSAIGLALGSINGAFNLDVALTALENSGKGRILSTPRLTTQNNQPAEVAQGVQIPIQTVANNTVSVQFRDAVLQLKVTPQITMANTVIMNITIENATPDFSRQVNGIPPIDTQRALTTVQVNDGATTVIGGIFVSQEQSTNDRTPVLHRVPLLKWLFQRNTLTDTSRELLIFITPRILRG
jgi:type IV pilus assembly protein PilQ